MPVCCGPVVVAATTRAIPRRLRLSFVGILDEKERRSQFEVARIPGVAKSVVGINNAVFFGSRMPATS